MNRLSAIFYSKFFLVFVSFSIVFAVLWNTYDFSQEFKKNERTDMEILAKAYDIFATSDLDQDVSLVAKIIESNHNIPMIVTDEQDNVVMKRNLDSIKSLDADYLIEQLVIMKDENEPIVIDYLVGKKYVIHYRDSDLLVRIRYYPITLLVILLLFALVVYLVFTSTKIAEQNKLWTGMAKETAHQIGTPLSSLLGWVELMKLQEKALDIVPEIQKDIDRLHIIADRFSKIGSVPERTPIEINTVLINAVSYFETRFSKSINFTSDIPATAYVVNANEQLMIWVFENLIKNAIDAMSGKGELGIRLLQEGAFVKILISDTGKGISKSNFKKIFTPGFTTKKRGWGLGLSLSKRIIKDYHNGKLIVKHSEIAKGSTFEVMLDISSKKQL
jgi:two-component system, sporulation sensor kinase D